MELKYQNVLFFTRTMKLGGTENVILQMCEVLKPYVNKIVVCSCGGINVKKLNKLDISHYIIPDIDSKSPSTIIRVFSKISKIIEQENITIVHTHHRMATFYMFFLKRLYHVKLVSTLHGTFVDKKIFTKIIYRQIEIIACGKIVKKNFVERYKIDERQITVVSNAIEKEKSKLVKLDCLSLLNQDYRKVGYIGRLSPEKGVDILIDSIVLVHKKNPKIIFVIAGNGNLENYLKEKVRQEKLTEYVYFLGYREDAQNIVKQMDATILPSFTEGLPLTPIESFAHGKPVVATAVGGTIEIVENEKNGILVPPGDKVALAEGILKLFSDERKYKQMCEEAYKTYIEKFSFEKFEKEILSFYKKI